MYSSTYRLRVCLLHAFPLTRWSHISSRPRSAHTIIEIDYPVLPSSVHQDRYQVSGLVRNQAFIGDATMDESRVGTVAGGSDNGMKEDADTQGRSALELATQSR